MTDRKHKLHELSDEIARQAANFGFRPLRYHPEAVEGGLWTKTAGFPGSRIVLSAYFGDVIKKEKDELWIGLYAQTSVFSTIQERLGDKITRIDVTAKTTRPEIDATIKTADELKGPIYEVEYDDSYLGFYEYLLAAEDERSKITEALARLLDIFVLVEPKFDNGISSDISDINKKTELNSTQREQLILARRGQGQYRSDLEKNWGGACAVTGIALREVLRASHALPWKDSEDHQRLDPNNGLLLVATLDALFDRGLISFNDDGKILRSRYLMSADKEEKLTASSMTLKRQLSDHQKLYMRKHRDRHGFQVPRFSITRV